VNDIFTRYLEMGAPLQLTPTQVQILREQSNGDPDAVETIQVEPGKPFVRTIPMRENDVDFVKIEPMDVK
jgi:xylan 1,4-beta-xylosidase